MRYDPYIALRRFGLGVRPDEPAAIANAARDYVMSLVDPTAALIRDPRLPETMAGLKQLYAFQDEERLARMSRAGMEGDPLTAGLPVPKPLIYAPQKTFEAEMNARLNRQLRTDNGLVERLVSFWSNHFCVSAEKDGIVRQLAGAYERECIRPFVLGRFRDMLRAVSHHPAMLAFLDNMQSFGPNSQAGQKQKRGLNENLAREIMELHVIGVSGGYSQADVTSFARALTGWSIAGRGAPEGPAFRFLAERHEPGTVQIMSVAYDQSGEAQAEAVMDDLCRKPATAKYIAGRFARHFVGDNAPASLVDRLATVFSATDGDLAAMTRALITSDEAWAAAPQKVLPPWDFMVALGRAFAVDMRLGEAQHLLQVFGQKLWAVPSPKGWPDDDNAWAAPDALLQRLDQVQSVCGRLVGTLGKQSIGDVARACLGPSANAETLQQIDRAAEPQQALALMLMSPDFLRR
jgi:uncharacterized protein (DUF1800 family)